MKRILSVLIVLCLVLSLSSGLVTNVSAATYVYNWGTRGTVATALSDAAKDFYSDNNTSYELLSSYTGSSSISSVPSSKLYDVLQDLMAANHSWETSYGDTRSLYKYTDCENGGGKISSFYSGKAIGPDWDGGATWNREHTWPNSKGDASGNGENDIMMLRPASVSENSSRGNKAYGESSGYYNPNSESGGKYDLRGDVSRIMLYVYVRWGNTGSMWGSSGVIESKAVMLRWMEEDPVDTWELGRNDSVESMTGTRNVFVDYPELAWLLFGEEVPDDMVTPSGEAMNGTGSTTPCEHTDSNKDNKCDQCGEVICKHPGSKLDETTVKAATCKAGGYTGDEKCTECGLVTKAGTATDPLPHTNVNPKDNKCDICGGKVDYCLHGESKLTGYDAASCDEPGYTGDYVCIYCFDITTPGKVIAPLGHLNEDHDNVCERCGGTLDQDECGHGRTKVDRSTARTATCEKEGYTGDIICFYCELKVGEGDSIPKTAHTNADNDNVCDVCRVTLSQEECGHGKTKLSGVKEPTCTASGYTGDTICFYCDEVLDNGEVIPMLEHDWIPADCEHAQICSECQETDGEALGHNWSKATCTTLSKCSRCGNTQGTFADHRLTETKAKNATCTENGNKAYYTCADCHKVFSDKYGVNVTTVEAMTLPAHHTDADQDQRCDDCNASLCATHQWVNATCEKPQTCSVCGQTQGEALGHKWVAADCDTPETCSVCHSTNGKPAGHKLTETKAKDATCTENGNQAYHTCAVCLKVFSDKYGVNETTAEAMILPATGHTDSNQDLHCDVCKVSICTQHTWTDATCDKAKTCTNCGDTEGLPLGHTWVDATCTAPKTCSVCRKTEGKALGHSFGPVQYGKHSCTVCGYEEIAEQPTDCPHPETVLKNERAATCTNAGYTGDFYCADCNKMMQSGTVIPATGHTDANEDKLCDTCNADLSCPHSTTQLKDAKNATCSEEGYTGDVCCVSCGSVVTQGEVIPATGEHKFGQWVHEDGLNSRTCQDCGYVETAADAPTEPSETEPAPTKPSETKPSETKPVTPPVSGDSQTDPTSPTEPEPDGKFPVVPVIIVILLLLLCVIIVILVLKKKKKEQ